MTSLKEMKIPSSRSALIPRTAIFPQNFLQFYKGHQYKFTPMPPPIALLSNPAWRASLTPHPPCQLHFPPYFGMSRTRGGVKFSPKDCHCFRGRQMAEKRSRHSEWVLGTRVGHPHLVQHPHFRILTSICNLVSKNPTLPSIAQQHQRCLVSGNYPPI